MNHETELEIEPELDIEPDAAPAEESEIEPEPEPTTSAALVARPLIEVLPADFQLPLLTKFVADVRLKERADHAASYALSIDVTGAEGLQRADLALSTLRDSQKAITGHFEEPAAIANKLHKQITSIRGEWLEEPEKAYRAVGQRVHAERQRLERVAAEERRKAQAEADRQARDTARREAEQAEHAKAPASVVEQLKREAETATAPPVATPAPVPTMRGVSTVTTWKARLAGAAADVDPNPKVSDLTISQRQKLFELLQAILAGKAPLTAVEINWSVLNARAKADKSTLAIPGIEAYTEGGVRARGRRA